VKKKKFKTRDSGFISESSSSNSLDEDGDKDDWLQSHTAALLEMFPEYDKNKLKRR